MIVAADNLTSANPVVADALARLDPGPLQDLARRCLQAGAAYLDINPGYLSPAGRTAWSSWWPQCKRCPPSR